LPLSLLLCVGDLQVRLLLLLLLLLLLCLLRLLRPLMLLVMLHGGLLLPLQVPMLGLGF
jgi:hypothetical protein